jgi:HEAT repeat protein
LRSIATVLGWLGGPTVETALTRLLGQPSARKEVVEAMVRHGAHVIDLLIQALESPELDIREAAIIALGRIGDARAVPALVNALENDPESVIVTAGALAKIGDRRAFEALINQMGHPNPAMRQAIVSALNSIGHPDMCGRIGNLLRDENPRVRESAVKIAGYFGYEDCTDQLFALSHDPDEGVRRAVIETIVFLEDERSSTVLFNALQAEVPAVRAAAARAMAHLEGVQARDQLLAAAKDGDVWVRYFAARSLTRFPSDPAWETLAQLALHDPATPVRLAAIESLGTLGGPRAEEILGPLSQSPFSEIVHTAAQAIKAARQPVSDPGKPNSTFQPTKPA